MKFDSPSNQPWGIVKDGFIRCSWNRLVNSRNFSINTVNQMINTIYNHFIFSYSSKEIRGSENRIVFFSKSFESNNHVHVPRPRLCGKFSCLRSLPLAFLCTLSKRSFSSKLSIPYLEKWKRSSMEGSFATRRMPRSVGT